MYDIVYLPLSVRYCLQMGARGIVWHASQGVYYCLQAAAISSYKQQHSTLYVTPIKQHNKCIKQQLQAGQAPRANLTLLFKFKQQQKSKKNKKIIPLANLR